MMKLVQWHQKYNEKKDLENRRLDKTSREFAYEST